MRNSSRAAWREGRVPGRGCMSESAGLAQRDAQVADALAELVGQGQFVQPAGSVRGPGLGRHTDREIRLRQDGDNHHSSEIPINSLLRMATWQAMGDLRVARFFESALAPSRPRIGGRGRCRRSPEATFAATVAGRLSRVTRAAECTKNAKSERQTRRDASRRPIA